MCVCACVCVCVFAGVSGWLRWVWGRWVGSLGVCLCVRMGEFATVCLACTLQFASALSCWPVDDGRSASRCDVYNSELDWTPIQDLHVLLRSVGSACSWPMGYSGVGVAGLG